jgi:hypothetical protein
MYGFTTLTFGGCMAKSSSGCLPLGGLLARLLGGPAAPTGPALPKVAPSNKFITAAEADFFRVLRDVVGPRGVVFAQVSLRQLLYFPGNNQSNPGRTAWENKVARRSVDFVICHPNTLAPLVVIELDDSTHAKPDRQQRDDEVDMIVQAAGLPMLRVLASRTYHTNELNDLLSPYLRA